MRFLEKNFSSNESLPLLPHAAISGDTALWSSSIILSEHVIQNADLSEGKSW